MNVTCFYDQTPFTLGMDEKIAALRKMHAENLHHYDARCPRCGRANAISRERLEMFTPGWEEAIKAPAAAPVSASMPTVPSASMPSAVMPVASMPAPATSAPTAKAAAPRRKHAPAAKRAARKTKPAPKKAPKKVAGKPARKTAKAKARTAKKKAAVRKVSKRSTKARAKKR
jgi:hypothetical protein